MDRKNNLKKPQPGISSSVARWLLAGENSRSTLALLHFFTVALLPLLITVVLFVYFQNNSAEFAQQSLGIKLAGPIAAYASLVIVMKYLLKDVFINLREEDLHREKLRLIDLSAEDAIEKSGIFARMAADFCLMEMLSLRRRGYSKEDTTLITSTVRKQAYQLTKVLGSHTIEEGKYSLSKLTTAAINNSEFIQELVKFIDNLLIDEAPKQTEPNPYSDVPGVVVAHMGPNYQKLPGPAPVPVPPATIFANLDVVLARKKLTNIIWRQCEHAIKSPEVALKNELNAP
jgi:hypothetical protein